MRDRFREAGIDNAELDARLLAQFALGLDSLGLLAVERQQASPEQIAALDALAARRLAGEPVARIAGEKEFYGLPFALNEATLVPRPETELLVDLALAWLKRHGGGRILDLGTGTGVIPIAITHSAPGATAIATDLSERALAQARANAQRHGLGARIAFRQGSWFDPIEPGEQFALILSNPPYIESAVIATLHKDVRDFDPLLALDGGPDGLAPYRVIAEKSGAHLAPGGAVMVEIGAGQGSDVAAIFGAAGFAASVIEKDLAGLDRVVIAHHL